VGDVPQSWRRTLHALWVAQLLTIIGFSLRTPFLPFYVAELGATTFEEQALWAGAITAGGAAVMAMAAPIWGVLADRHGRKLMVLRAMFAGSLTVSLMALATSPWQLLALRFAEGAFTGTVAASTTLAASTVPKERLGYGLGLMQMAVFSGSAVGPLLGGVLADTVGYRLTFLLAGAMLFASGGIVLLLVHEQFERASAESGSWGTRNATLTLLWQPALLAVIGGLLALRSASGALQPIVPLLVEQLAGDSSAVNSLAGLSIGIAGLTSAVASAVIGRAGDHFGVRRLLIATSLLAGLTYLPLAAAQSVTHLVLLQAAFGLVSGGMLPTANALIAHLTPAERRGTVYGFTTTATAVGGFVGPLGGAALAATFSIRVAFVAMGALLLVAALWLWQALSPSQQRADDEHQPAPITRSHPGD
jgi:DHA1 family multidrug resistance protein-like MFS transporter